MADMVTLETYRDLESKKNNEITELERKLKVETELSKRFSFACREYEQLTKEQDEHLVKLEQENTNQKDQLTKAAELIDKLLKTPQTIFKEDEDGEAYPFYNPEFANIQKQAKQFLREVDLKEGCPDTLCEDCTKEDCSVRKLGLVPNKEL